MVINKPFKIYLQFIVSAVCNLLDNMMFNKTSWDYIDNENEMKLT